MGTISKNFSFREFEVTDEVSLAETNHIVDFTVRDSIKALVDTVLQPLRDKWGRSLYINSGFRTPAVNKAVGGEPTSQHLKGEAADVCPFGGRNMHGDSSVVFALAKMAKELDLPYDQMILYPSFVHFSHRLHGKQRKQILYSKTYRGARF